MTTANSAAILVTSGLSSIGRHVPDISRDFGYRVIGLGRGDVVDAELAAGDWYFNGTGDEPRDLVHVHGVVRLVDTAAKRASAALPVVNDGIGALIRVRDALMQIRELWLPPISTIAFSGGTRPGDPPDYHADTARARSFGWAQKLRFGAGLVDDISSARDVLS